MNPAQDAFAAQFDHDGPKVSVNFNKKTGWLEVTQVSAAPNDMCFTWIPGTRLVLSRASGRLASADLEDWTVYTDGGSFDSRDRASRRGWLSAAVLALFFLSIPGLVVGEVIKKAKEADEATRKKAVTTASPDPKDAVEHWIRNVRGSNDQETKVLQELLKGVVLGGQYKDQVLDSLTITRPSTRRSKWIKATRRFNGPCDQFLAALQGYRQSTQ